LKKFQFPFLGVIGTISTVEEIYFFYQFLKLTGNSNFLINKDFYFFNKDLPLFYQFNSGLKTIDQVDFIFLVGINSR